MPRKSPRDIPAMREKMWKKGQSGNPKGRPKNLNFEEQVMKVLREKVPGSTQNKLQALARVFVDEVLMKRNHALLREFMEREWPRTHHIELETHDPAAVSDLEAALDRVSVALAALETPDEPQPTGANGSGRGLQ